MQDLFPEDPKLALFTSRFTSQGFDPIATRPIVSPQTQARPKMALQSIEQPQPIMNSPRPSIIAPLQMNQSPKRPLDDSDNESVQPRKIARGDSPLKGAAGRRLNAKNTSLRNEVQQNGGTPLMAAMPPPPLPAEVLRLLSMIPRAETYNATRFNAERMVNLIRVTDFSRANVNRLPVATPQPQASPYGYPAMPR